MANCISIKGEAPFQVLSHSFIVSPSQEGYTLNYSADGVHWTAWSEATPAGENLITNGVAWGTYIKLLGNNTEVKVSY